MKIKKILKFEKFNRNNSFINRFKDLRYKNNRKLFFLLNVSIGLNLYSYFYKTDLIIYC